MPLPVAVSWKSALALLVSVTTRSHSCTHCEQKEFFLVAPVPHQNLKQEQLVATRKSHDCALTVSGRTDERQPSQLPHQDAGPCLPS